MELINESLLAVPIKDDEIFELLERLAATEEMFKAPVSTIRDVAELTDASPNLIARLLGEIRGPGEFEKMQQGIADHEGRIQELEQKFKRVRKSKLVTKPFELKQPPRTVSNLPIIPTSGLEELDLLTKQSDDASAFIATTYGDLLKKEREAPDYRIIEGIPPGIALLAVALILVVVYFLVFRFGIQVPRPALPPTYEFK